LNCSSEMILDSLNHAEEVLFYLAGLREQSVFNFCAIPQVMAIATQELCFRNYAMFQRNIKITKGDACQLMVDSTQNLRMVCEVFRKYGRRIHKKNTPKDPNFLKISIACGKIEKFIETLYPSQTAEDAKRKLVGRSSKEVETKTAEEAEARQDLWIMVGIMSVILLFVTVIMMGTAWALGARFDLAFNELRKGNFIPKNADSSSHNEL